MSSRITVTRRRFLQDASALGLLIAFKLDTGASAEPASEFIPNAFLRIAPDSTVTAISKHIEFGQGTYTGIATVLANELDAEWSQIRVESAPADLRRYVNLAYRTVQGTGGSNAMANSWDQLRQAGAQARALLVAAAAKQWKVAPDSITIEQGVLKGAGQSATFGEVATLAQSLTIEGPFKPKNPADWRLIGTHLPKVDTIPKTNGTATYTIDIALPDLATCLIARPPRFGASVKEFDASAALAVPGVKEAFVVPEGVAVLADGFWSAKKGRDALRVTWDETGTEARGSKEIIAQYIDVAQTEGARARNEGDVTNALAQASKTIEATYIFPYLAHAPLEPNDCVIRRTDDGGVELMLGSQMQSIDQQAAADVMGLSIDRVKVKTLLAGGSFGRRGTPRGDMAIEAANVLKAAKHSGPIKVMWTREDDIRGARYRPLFVERVRGGLDADGNVIAWDHVLVGQSFVKGTRFEASMLKEGFDERMVNGASSLPYAVPNLRISSHVGEVGISTLWWRSVASNHTGYSTETFVDLLAHTANTDPVAFRQKLLSKQPRHLRVLNLAAEKAGWGGPLGDGRARGVAVHQSFKTYVAYVVEVSIGEDKLPKVERVVAAVDCGIAINPDVVTAQIEGGMGFGLSAALYGSIDLEDGRVKQSNFHDYRVLRINEMPPIEVHIVASTERPTGIGEPGVPPIGPAVANAWAKLTGQRIYELPFSRSVPRST
jgi:isoquinoline 1-oxidoreductase subunit beta